MSILSTSDFVGTFQLAVNQYNEDSFSTFFEKMERQYLVRLLGAELYGLFYADLSGTPSVPTNPIYTAIFNKMEFDNGYIFISEGMKEMLKGFVFYEWVKENQLYDTIAGMVTNNIENANSQAGTTVGAQYILNKFNEAMVTFEAIQEYIKLHISNYPDFNGCKIYKSPVFW